MDQNIQKEIIECIVAIALIVGSCYLATIGIFDATIVLVVFGAICTAFFGVNIHRNWVTPKKCGKCEDTI